MLVSIFNNICNDYVEENEVLATLYSSKYEDMSDAMAEFYNTMEIVPEEEYNLNYKNKMKEKMELVYAVINSDMC